MSRPQPVNGRVTGPFFLISIIIIALSFYYMAKRFTLGLGAVTNMNDGYPWGIWIAYDVVVGTSFACGGYVMAIMVYVFNRGRYHPLVRPALTASVFGYSLAGFSVFLDLGRYWQMYNIFLPNLANPNSVLLEVALCIATYTLVLWIEFTPAFLEKIGNKSLKERLDKIIFFIIALGVLLPTMHQSSLGSLMIAAGHKLSPLWWSPFLPLFYLVSALTMGYAAVIFESSIASISFNTENENDILTGIGAIIRWLIVVFIVVRLIDLMARGALPLAFAGDTNGNWFLAEMALLVIPAAIFFCRDCRTRPAPMFIASVLLMLSGAVYRFSCYLIGFDPGEGWQYFPAFGEIMITLGIIAIEIAAYIVFVNKLPVLPVKGQGASS